MYRKLLLLVAMILAAGAAATAQIAITAENPTVSQNFDSMWDASTQEALLAMPNGWRIDRNITSPRTLNAFESADTEVMYTGGVNLASNAKNGTWNWGASDNESDRAVGGLSTGVSGGTRCVSIMTRLHNADEAAIDKLTFSYDIEKFRLGSNSAGFDVQLYYSTDGVTWTSAGDDFKTHFEPDASTIGADVVPISVTSVTAKTMRLAVEPDADIYLAWNISVASGTAAASAMGLALDNVSVTASFAGSGEENIAIYVEDVTKWNTIMMSVDGGTPQEAAGSASVNGVNYKFFEMTKDDASHTLTFTNGNASVNYGIVADTDKYLCLTADEATAIDDPSTYTGWVDPTRPPFVASGIYLRGEVNSWGSPTDWEFSDEGDGMYVLYDKTLTGQFKVADASWSSACNYGSNGSSISLDTPYALILGTNDNISCGGNTYVTKRIVLTINASGTTLLLESDDDPSGLTSVFIMGDHNGWNYMDTSGELALNNDGLFEGQVTLSAGEDGLSHWRLYQRLGMVGVWGAPGGADLTESVTTGTLEKGSTGRMATTPGTYRASFDINTGAFNLELLGSVPTTMTIEPAQTILVPTLPEEVKVLSLNNSLIHYNDQDLMFNSIAQAMGKNASWKKHSLLGKTLNAHWNEGEGLAEDGTPGAKMLIRNEAWSHIILQEQSGLPRTDFETARANLKQWVEYIREYCPNPNAIIILPINWAYSGDWENFSDFNKTFLANYQAMAREFGLTLCPVGVAYEQQYEQGGAESLASWFQDDRHPTEKSTYLAACMEYGLIFGEDPANINWAPDAVNATDAQAMRTLASQVMNGFENIVDHTAGIVRYKVTVRDQFGMEIEPENEVVVTTGGGGTISGTNFIAGGEEGTFTVTATCGTFVKDAVVTVAQPVTEVVVYPAIELNEDVLAAGENFNAMGSDATASMPDAWRIARNTEAPRLVGRWDEADTQTMNSGGVNLASNAKNGTWNFGDNTGNDRAVGGISTGVTGGTRGINVYAHLLNTGKKRLVDVVVGYNVEKYRKGSNTAGFDVQLYYSIDGRNWTSAGDRFKTHFDPDSETAGYAEVPGETVAVSDTLPIELQPGVDLFLAWNISVASGTAAASAMALAIDDFSISADLPKIPVAKHYVYAEDKTGWDALGLYAWGDSELFGAWPGEAVVGETTINGIDYKVFLLDVEGGNFHLIFNNWNNGSQLPDYDIVADRDYYFTLSATAATEVDPATYGVLKGDVNGDGVVSGADVTALYNVLLDDATPNGGADVNGDGVVSGADVTALYN
ncbi:MAG: hypothetical protein J6X70_03615, partial [Muribaculaceae bacterium]|nr:hypothetical protein [Muribaculaceae bacterium]